MAPDPWSAEAEVVVAYLAVAQSLELLRASRAGLEATRGYVQKVKADIEVTRRALRGDDEPRETPPCHP
jgi:hypothetical protein